MTSLPTESSSPVTSSSTSRISPFPPLPLPLSPTSTCPSISTPCPPLSYHPSLQVRPPHRLARPLLCRSPPHSLVRPQHPMCRLARPHRLVRPRRPSRRLAPPGPPSSAQPRAASASPSSPHPAPASPAGFGPTPASPALPRAAPSSRFTNPIQTYQRRDRGGPPIRPRAEPLPYHPVIIHRDPRHIHPMVTRRAAGVLRAPDRLILSASSSPTLPPVPTTVRGALADPQWRRAIE